MRKDMFKIIVERPRRGGKDDKKTTKNESSDMLPAKQSMKRAHYDRKELNENLAPLKRFLNKNVGRPWDKVYSEICDQISVNSTVQQHVRQHIPNYVKLDVRVQGKQILSKNAHYRSYYELSDGELYVHPSTGILRKYKNRTAIPSKPNEGLEWNADPVTRDLTALLSRGRSKTIVRDGVYWKVHKNPNSGTWDVFNVATIAHARSDWSDVLMIQNFVYSETFFRTYEKHLSSTKSAYLRCLYSYYVEYRERNRKKKT
jgi:hypothetical protein